MTVIEVYSGDASAMKFNATEDDYRLITDITNKYYNVMDLTAEGTFLYRVKTLYIDGTESDWSNVEEVTLFENGTVLLGDVNRDGIVSIKDVTDMIDYLLGTDIDIDLVAADVNQDGSVTIKDGTDLIDMLLGGGSQATLYLKRPNTEK